MKILSLSNCPLVEQQGSGYVILNFCRGLRERGHQVDLFGPDAYTPLKFMQGRAKNYRQALGMLLFLVCQIRKQKYDIIEFYGGDAWLATTLLNWVPNRDFLLVSHSNGLEPHYYEVLIQHHRSGLGDHPFPQWYQFNQAALFVNAFTQVDAVVTVSDYDRDYALRNSYQDKSHILSIENPLSEDYLGLPVQIQRGAILGYCGSWIPRKGVKLIELDITQLLMEFPQYSFKLIGVGEDFRKENHFPPSVWSQIEVIPFVASKKQLRSLYQTLSILIAPSLYESFGLVIAEAMACGCAVVAGKTGFAAHLRNREEAMLLEKPASPSVYQAVRELLLDESLRSRIATHGYQRVQQLRWDTAVERLENAYLGWLHQFRQPADQTGPAPAAQRLP